MSKVNGLYVNCGVGEDFFSDAESALRYAAFMAQLGYDSVYYSAWLVDGELKIGGRLREDAVKALIGRKL